MTTINDEQAQLKAEAIAARRAARPAWRNAHIDRLIREREARETSREYRTAQSLAGKQCSSCSQTLSLDSFSPAFRDRPTARCKSCVAAATRARYQGDLEKARSRTRNRPPPNPDRQRQSAEERQRKAADRKRAVEDRQRTKAEALQRKATERVAYLAGLLQGTIPGEKIASEESWDVASSELRSLWLLSGDKECVSCKSVIPPTAMHPPGPANFYPGKCRSCVHEEREQNHWEVFGRAPEGPRPILLRDGTSITIGEFARRHREREGRSLSLQKSEAV